ncbi:MAG TPA: hypothetical protein VGV15_09085 [Terriglobales bacterium]|nr:hypothetical protein [Terriglobales bacterium]
MLLGHDEQKGLVHFNGSNVSIHAGKGRAVQVGPCKDSRVFLRGQRCGRSSHGVTYDTDAGQIQLTMPAARAADILEKVKRARRTQFMTRVARRLRATLFPLAVLERRRSCSDPHDANRNRPSKQSAQQPDQDSAN